EEVVVAGRDPWKEMPVTTVHLLVRLSEVVASQEVAYRLAGGDVRRERLIPPLARFVWSAVRRSRELRLAFERAHHEDALATLRHAVVGGEDDSFGHAVAEVSTGRQQLLEPWGVVVLVGKAVHVLEQEGTRPRLVEDAQVVV